MILRHINGVPTENLGYSAVLDLTRGDVRGLTLSLQHDDASDRLGHLSRPASVLTSMPNGAGPHPRGAVACDESSDDDDERGIVKVKFGADDMMPLGITFLPISIRSVDPEGLAQSCVTQPLQPGMVLQSINGASAASLNYASVLATMDGTGDYALKQLSLTFRREETELHNGSQSSFTVDFHEKLLKFTVSAGDTATIVATIQDGLFAIRDWDSRKQD